MFALFFSSEQFIIIFSLVDYSPVHYGTYVYPVWCEVIGWLMALVSVAMIPTFAVVEYILHSEGDTPWEVSYIYK